MSPATSPSPRTSAWAKHPEYRVDFESCPRRLRALFAGASVADSGRAMYMLEGGHVPVYYFPRADVRVDLMRRTDHATFCPFKGEASYWSIAAGGRVAENAAWSYETPFEEVAGIKDYVAFYWDQMDAWYEEDEEVFVHARDPHVRVDVLASSRPVQVFLGGECVADSGRARFLFETGMPTRYYVPREDVRMDVLEPTDTVSRCPYKGTARYWSVRAGGDVFEDAVWSYPEPLAECARIEDYLCFFNERVDAITVDGEPVPEVRTRWSRDT